MDLWLRPAFADLVQNMKFSDCRILVENNTFHCHKVILASSSKFFERMFLSSFSESESDDIRLNEVKPETFAKFIQYVYTFDEKTLDENSNSMIMELLICGNQWLVDSIVSECEMILNSRAHIMCASDLVELFQVSHNIDNKELINISIQCLMNRFSNSIYFNDFLSLTSDAFEHYIILTEKHISVINRFKMIQSYVMANGLIDIDPAETLEEGVDYKKEGDSGIGEKVIAKIPQDIAENLDDGGKPDKIGQDGARKPRTEEPKNTKIKELHSKYLQTLLGHLKFQNMSRADFYNYVGKTQWLTIEEKYENLYLCHP